MGIIKQVYQSFFIIKSVLSFFEASTLQSVQLHVKVIKIMINSRSGALNYC